jgi:DNA-binding response OmpR family regulator
MNNVKDTLRGRRLLIVEDEYLLAQDLTDYFQQLGVEVIGPVGSVSEALKLLNLVEVHGAILDINLRGERVYPVADALRQKRVPFIFASGYGGETEPAAYADVPRCIKPVDFSVLAKAVSEHIQVKAMPKQVI